MTPPARRPALRWLATSYSKALSEVCRSFRSPVEHYQKLENSPEDNEAEVIM